MAAIKTGMLASRRIIETVARELESCTPERLVCDPVMVSKAGARLLDEDAVDALVTELLPLATVVTPNVDHVVQAEENQALRAAYEDASLSLVDGQPLVWLSKLMGEPFPEKISGSDFVPRVI